MGKLLSDLLVPDAVIFQLSVEDPEQVIQVLGSKLYQAGYVKDCFIQAVSEREMQLPTGVPLDGDYNVALPHTDVKHVNRSAIALAVLSHPVMFHNMVSPEELVPVSMVFLIAIDHEDAQVEMLQEIADILQHPELVRKLMMSSSVYEVQLTINHAH